MGRGRHVGADACRFLYLAIVLDVFGRRIVGWAMDSSLATDLVVDTLEMAIAQRRLEGVIHHSDQGSQYTSLGFGKRCRDAGIALSMGSVGDCHDNAMAESFFANPECELLDQTRFRNHAEAKPDLFRYIEGWYNPHRRHSAIRNPVTRQLRDELSASCLTPQTLTVQENGATPVPFFC